MPGYSSTGQQHRDRNQARGIEAPLDGGGNRNGPHPGLGKVVIEDMELADLTRLEDDRVIGAQLQTHVRSGLRRYLRRPSLWLPTIDSSEGPLPSMTLSDDGLYALFLVWWRNMS